MDYKKKYKDALERARQVHTTNVDENKKSTEYIFPELKESEDEILRKELIKLLKQLSNTIVENYTTIEISTFVDWLEKQGSITKLSEEEQNKFAKGVLTSCAMSFIDYLDAHKYEGKMCVSNGECEDIENAFHNDMWDRLHRYYCKYIEKQGEQKHTDKVEPKFKVGNWYQCTKDFFGKGVTFDKNTAYYCAQEGCLQNKYGCHIAIVKDLYDNFKLWTIQDAKDGDVLAVNNEVFIYAHRKQMYPIAIAHCFVDSAGGFYYDGEFGYIEKGNSIHPATKEQRDTLMEAMADAGYTFDFEKKELKKIEQKSAWIEDDEKMLNIIIEKGDLKLSEIYWLKSIKERIKGE